MSHQIGAMKLAVLIDGENVSAAIADGLFADVSKIGEASVRRVYGDFAAGKLKGWSDQLALHGIVPHHQPANVSGKNSSDIALVIDAMDLLLKSGKWLDGFCIVSSDSDFARLASSIREEGREVFGFGAENTPASFRNACKQFFVTCREPADQKSSGKPAQTLSPSRRLPIEAVPTLTKAVGETAGKGGWVTLSQVGSHLRSKYSGFNRKDFGAAMLCALFRRTGKFEVAPQEGRPMKVRILPQAKAA